MRCDPIVARFSVAPGTMATLISALAEVWAGPERTLQNYRWLTHLCRPRARRLHDKPCWAMGCRSAGEPLVLTVKLDPGTEGALAPGTGRTFGASARAPRKASAGVACGSRRTLGQSCNTTCAAPVDSQTCTCRSKLGFLLRSPVLRRG